MGLHLQPGPEVFTLEQGTLNMCPSFPRNVISVTNTSMELNLQQTGILVMHNATETWDIKH